MWKLLRLARGAVLIVMIGAGTATSASTPDWLREAAQAPIPSYSDDTDAVVLLDETITSVSASGEVRTTHRKAYKILRPKGRKFGLVDVFFDSETQLTFLKGWSIAAHGEEYEVKEKDAVETGLSSESLYSDSRRKLLLIPASQPGNIVGYEYQQRQRPHILQDVWDFQSDIPVRHARFTLDLPPNWVYTMHWRNHASVDPQRSGDNRWTWEFRDVEPVQSEPQMPNWQSVAGHLGISFASSGSDNTTTWDQIGHWYGDLTLSRREITPSIRAKAQQIVEGSADDLEKVRRLATYVQNEIRYVAIEIGIGGYQPHAAQQVLVNRYGDCKDKATLLSAMLATMGFDSYYLLVNADRDYLSPEFPSLLNFNHVILAIRLPENIVGQVLPESLVRTETGTYLPFDPTETSTRFGYLPPSLQASRGLLVTKNGSELVKLPLFPPSLNRVLRVGILSLDSSGTLKGNVRETRSGPAAVAFTERLKNLPSVQRQKVFEDLLGDLIEGAVLTEAGTSDLNTTNNWLAITYSFTMPGYAQHVGPLFLFRPCALCRKPSGVMAGNPRQYPIVFRYTTSESDVFDISFPSDLTVDELPQPVNYKYQFATYTSLSHVDQHILHYQRTYELSEIRVSVDELEQLKTFFEQVGEDRGAYVLMKWASTPPPLSK